MGCLWSCIKWYFIIKLAGIALLLILYLIAGAFVYVMALVNEVIKFW